MENIRFFLIDQLGMIIGEEEEDKNDKVKIKYPLIIQPNMSQDSKSQFAMATHPFFKENMIVESRYIIARSEPKKELIEQYKGYRIKQSTGIITPPSGLIK